MDVIKVSKIIKSKRKTIAIEINKKAEIVVKAPCNVPDEIVWDFVNKKIEWIKRKQYLVRQRNNSKIQREFVQGEGFLYLGKIYKLNIVTDLSSPFEFKEDFFLSSSYVDYARDLFVKWYKENALSEIKKSVEQYAFLRNLRYKKVRLSSGRCRLGSCSAKGNLNFNWRLIMAPQDIINYVVVHELMHLVEKNHSKRFWHKVSELFPNFKQARKWLRDNAYLLDI